VPRSDRASRLARALLARFPPRSHVLLGGSTIADEELGAIARGQLERTELWVLPLLALLLLAIFRRPTAAALALAIGVLALLETLAALRVLHSLGVHVSLFCLPVASGLALGLGIDYGLLGISRFREEAGGRTAPDAARATLATAGRTILFSALTIGCCGAALIPVSVPLVSSGGLAVALCAAAAAFNALVLLPAVCILFALGVQTSGHERGSELWGNLAAFVTRRPAPIALAVAGCLIAFGVPALGLRFHGVDVEALPRGADARTAAAVLQNEFEPAVSDEVVSLLVHAPRASRAAVVRYKERIAGLPEVRDTHEATAIAPGLWQIELASRGTRLSSTSVALVRQLRRTRAPFGVEVSSPSASYLDQRAALRGALPAILLAIALGTCVPLLAMTRSLVLPLKTLLLNALTFAATFGLVVLLFQRRPLMGVFADGSSGYLETAQPVLMLSAVFGLSTDYNVFVISRIQEARREGRSERTAIAGGLARSGPVVTAAAFVLCCTLAAFASSSIMLIRETALGMAIAVAIDATLVRALLLPALMALLGRYNWWLPMFRIRRVRGLFGYSRPDVDSKARTRSGHG
jgi:RND superfamily putative drug exporter